MTATILICDDDSAIRTVLNQALGRAGYDVRTTGTAAGLWRWRLPPPAWPARLWQASSSCNGSTTSAATC